MSKFLNIFGPAAGAVAVTLGGAYMLAGNLVTDMPPLESLPVATATEIKLPSEEARLHDGVFGLGRPALTEEVAAWDIDVRPDGAGLPEGEGDVWTGEEVFVANCASCHGDFGEAVGRWPVLAGGHDTLADEDPVKTIGSYWPYLSTVWDYVNRAMPFGYAQSLTPDEVYAITAYLLYVNDLVEDDFVLSHENFAEVRLPNEENFFMDDRAETEYAIWNDTDLCMDGCKDVVEITMQAMVLDVTPESEGESDEVALLPVAERTTRSHDGAFGLGRPALTEEVAAWDIDVRPDGVGLPEGEGDVWTGEEVFVELCAACHGDFGEAVGRWPVLAGGHDTLTHEDPVKTIGSYWPYLSTVFDYVNRAMPFGYAQSLTPDEVYAITAYLLYVNDLVDDDFVLSHENFAEVRLPNEENFFMDDRAETEYAIWTGEGICMEDCKETVDIAMRAAVLDVTPDDGTSEGEGEANEASAEGNAEEAPAEDSGPDMAELIADGEGVFRQCKACHQVGEGARNGTGPHLNGILDRPIGAIEGFRYSGVMMDAADAGQTWTVEELTAFLQDPRGTFSGTKMAFGGLRSAEDVAAVLAYIEAEGG